VRLADGSALSTAGRVVLKVSGGAFTYSGTFIVLEADVPPILGMTFFTDTAPVVDW
jgi:uncharacterized protein (UPF0261 family)